MLIPKYLTILSCLLSFMQKSIFNVPDRCFVHIQRKLLTWHRLHCNQLKIRDCLFFSAFPRKSHTIGQKTFRKIANGRSHSRGKWAAGGAPTSKPQIHSCFEKSQRRTKTKDCIFGMQSYFQNSTDSTKKKLFPCQTRLI